MWCVVQWRTLPRPAAWSGSASQCLRLALQTYTKNDLTLLFNWKRTVNNFFRTSLTLFFQNQRTLLFCGRGEKRHKLDKWSSPDISLPRLQLCLKQNNWRWHHISDPSVHCPTICNWMNHYLKQSTSKTMYLNSFLRAEKRPPLPPTPSPTTNMGAHGHNLWILHVHWSSEVATQHYWKAEKMLEVVLPQRQNGIFE